MADLPSCPICLEVLGFYGGPATLPCGHNGCLDCLRSVLERAGASCPMCRASAPSASHLGVNRQVEELLGMAAATSAGSQERQEFHGRERAVITYIDVGDDYSYLQLAPSAPLPPPATPHGHRLDVAAFLSASASREGIAPPLPMIMSLEPPAWQPDSASEVCTRPSCGRPFSLLSPKHHCRCCGFLVCGGCSAARMLLPPLFRACEPQRVCRSCVPLLAQAQPALAATLARAARPPIRDPSSSASWRSIFHPPITRSLHTDVFSATAALTKLESLRVLDPRMMASCAGVAVLSLVRVGLGWSGGALGTGLVVARRAGGGGWTPPCAIAAAAVGVGPQIGVGLSSVIIVLRRRQALRMFTARALGVGATVSVAAGPVGREAAVGAFLGPKGHGSCVSYSLFRGAFTGVALESMAVAPRDAVNQRYYGCGRLSARALLMNDCGLQASGCAGLHRALDALAQGGEGSEGGGAAGAVRASC